MIHCHLLHSLEWNSSNKFKKHTNYKFFPNKILKRVMSKNKNHYSRKLNAQNSCTKSWERKDQKLCVPTPPEPPATRTSLEEEAGVTLESEFGVWTTSSCTAWTTTVDDDGLALELETVLNLEEMVGGASEKRGRLWWCFGNFISGRGRLGVGVKKKSSVAINETKHANASPKSCSRAKAWTKRAVGVCGGGYFCHRNADIAPNKCTTLFSSHHITLIW